VVVVSASVLTDSAEMLSIVVAGASAARADAAATDANVITKRVKGLI
jgi:hypothetical protein